MRIAVLGLGSMGEAFATRALDHGHDVTVWNRSPGRGSDLVKHGAVAAQDPAAAVAGAQVALVVVSDEAAVRDVAAVALPALPAGSVLAVVTTGPPGVAEALAGVRPDVTVLEAPVMGAPRAVAAGRARFLLAGNRSAIDRLAPLWGDLAEGYRYCGPIGAAAVLKIVLNSLLITHIAALAEAVTLARANGIGDTELREVLAGSIVLSEADRLRLDSVLSADHPGWFPPPLARKDLRLALGLAPADARLRVAPAVEAALTELVDSGVDWADFTALVETVRPTPPAG